MMSFNNYQEIMDYFKETYKNYPEMENHMYPIHQYVIIANKGGFEQVEKQWREKVEKHMPWRSGITFGDTFGERAAIDFTVLYSEPLDGIEHPYFRLYQGMYNKYK